MRLFRLRMWTIAIGFLLIVSARIQAEPDAPGVAAQKVRVRLTTGQKEMVFHSESPLTLETHQDVTSLPPGTYTVRVANAKPARQQFHLFIKTFLPSEADQAQEYLRPWKAHGYDPQLVTFGKRFKADSGAVLDNRSVWVSVARLPTKAEAEHLKTKLEAESVWGWIQAETTRAGEGSVCIANLAKHTVANLPAPVEIRAETPVEIRDLDSGFWKPQRSNRAFSGRLEFGVGPDGFLDLCETLPLEDYLAGVVPAEMPAGWPNEALKAQALTLRSEVMANWAGKHMLEGFDFCGTEHCRAYLGHSGRAPATDAAIAATAGLVLTTGGRILPAVFSANCGGWTEDNETVWSAPPNPALRGRTDCAQQHSAKVQPVAKLGIARWLKSAPPAYCSINKDHFRWVRRYSPRELTALVNKRYPVGEIRSIELGDRGVSGRLKWVKIIGSKRTETLRKELNIRLAFGGLDSAMFMVETAGQAERPTAFVFLGGGRGHGVGLCQDGARAMAESGLSHRQIVEHYFSGATVTRLKPWI